MRTGLMRYEGHSYTLPVFTGSVNKHSWTRPLTMGVQNYLSAVPWTRVINTDKHPRTRPVFSGWVDRRLWTRVTNVTLVVKRQSSFNVLTYLASALVSVIYVIFMCLEPDNECYMIPCGADDNVLYHNNRYAAGYTLITFHNQVLECWQ